MRVVIDCNIIISAFLKENSVPDRVMSLVLENGFFIVSEEVLQEYEMVLKRDKFRPFFRDGAVDEIISRFKPFKIPVHSQEILVQSRDPKDNKYLELAVAGRADCIVTGDKDLLCLHPYEGINIFTASGFLAHYSM